MYHKIWTATEQSSRLVMSRVLYETISVFYAIQSTGGALTLYGIIIMSLYSSPQLLPSLLLLPLLLMSTT